ncbi:MAG TPA: efflux transporter outer membrane subunit [Candidatus Sulfotelmatobacter sp.]|jgi:NodT family efflux transporter outer membrane factor (OMF) lipoprotein|nr:efflux transporter outer membrane subunit [Candidatus Sulfotelmatobacter sp.]
MNKTSLLATPVAVLLLAGCASWDGIQSESRKIDADRLALEQSSQGIAKNAPWPTQDWWAGYQDRQLDQLIAEALKDSPTLKAAQARIRKAAAQAGLSRSQLYPQVNASGSVTGERFTNNGLYPAPYAGNTRSDDRMSLDGSYDLDIWGGHEAEYRAALGGLHASEVEAQAARLELETAIAQAYTRLATEYDQLDISRELLRQKQEIQGLSAKLSGAGLVTDIENQQAEAAIAAAQAEITAGEERIALLRQTLAVLIGASPDRGTAIQRPALHLNTAIGLPSALPAELIGRRPDIVARRWRIEAATHGIDAAKAEFYPNINLKAFVGLQSIGLDQFLVAASRTYGAGPAITLPIFDAGRLRSNLAQDTASLDIEIEQYNGAVLSALQDIVAQLTSWQANQDALAQERVAVAHLEQAYRLAVLRYREGLTNYLTVLSAEGELIAQRRKVADSWNRQYALSIALAHALGGGFAPQTVPNS